MGGGGGGGGGGGWGQGIFINLSYKGVFHWTLSWSVREIGYVAEHKHFCFDQFQVISCWVFF